MHILFHMYLLLTLIEIFQPFSMGHSLNFSFLSVNLRASNERTNAGTVKVVVKDAYTPKQLPP